MRAALSIIALVTTSTVFSPLLAVPARLEKLSEKLLFSNNGEKSKESVTDSNADKKRTFDSAVAELKKLKDHVSSETDKSTNLNDSLENSLKKLHVSKHQLDGKNWFKSHVPKNEELIKEAIPASDESYVSSSNLFKPENMMISASSMLRQLDGKYSAYDMSQYIFWTGDEEGVAKAVEELIEKNLMTRESAIDFLNDVRIGINYLEEAYNFKDAKLKTEMPLNKERSNATTSPDSLNHSGQHGMFENLISPGLERHPTLIQLTNARSELERLGAERILENEDIIESRLTDFLLEVINQLAKTMFTESFKNHSKESQVALQTLTQFIDSEGKQGRIPSSFQKKILDVLLAALSATSNENPEIMKQTQEFISK